ncbi:YcbK family protein [Pararhizobium gei]|uniref:YcbK family protein n=1 Tax=Pararhizobium gei TaxID=1395951 RepID=UPI0023DB749D|nr:D-Ala-D-Ala carboxypeptidase family metallohydrolase [Rhizobium gei]
MRKIFPFLLAAALALSSAAAAGAADGTARKVKLKEHQMTAAYSVQTGSVKTGCFSTQLHGILAHIARQTGHRPVVTSGHRPHANRSKSQHRHCRAADIRVSGVSERKVLAAARTAPGIGGIGRYCNGIIHVDIGPKRHWTHC